MIFHKISVRKFWIRTFRGLTNKLHTLYCSRLRTSTLLIQRLLLLPSRSRQISGAFTELKGIRTPILLVIPTSLFAAPARSGLGDLNITFGFQTYFGLLATAAYPITLGWERASWFRSTWALLLSSVPPIRWAEREADQVHCLCNQERDPCLPSCRHPQWLQWVLVEHFSFSW